MNDSQARARQDRQAGRPTADGVPSGPRAASRLTEEKIRTVEGGQK